MALFAIARNSILFLYGWEVMAVSAFFLITTEDDKAEVRESGWIYFVATHAATLCLFSLFALLRAVKGSYTLEPLESGALTSGVFDRDFCHRVAGFRAQGRRDAVAHLAPQLARDRAESCVGDHVGRDHQRSSRSSSVPTRPGP